LLAPVGLGALVVLVAVAVVLALHGRDEPKGGVSSPPSTTRPSPSAHPTADGVRSFVTTYLQTASTDPSAGFKMLTPTFQDESGGLRGYEGFWGHVARIDSVERVAPSLGGDDPEVSYHYTYTMDDGSQHTEDVHLRLTYASGRYLIDGD